MDATPDFRRVHEGTDDMSTKAEQLRELANDLTCRLLPTNDFVIADAIAELRSYADRLDAVSVSDATAHKIYERLTESGWIGPFGLETSADKARVAIAALESILPIADEQRLRAGSRVRWTNQLGNTFTGTVCVNISVTFDDGTWRLFTPDELSQLRALASAKGDASNG